MSDPAATPPADPQAYVERVMAEIEEEVRLRRVSGDLPPRIERELDELFLAHSPVGERGGDLEDALRKVDAATFIDPVVPVESERPAGVLVKRGMRSLLLWYVGWVAHQVNQSTAAVARALHIVDGRLKELDRLLQEQRAIGPTVVEFPDQHGPGVWWAEPAADAVAKSPGRVLHAACGDGWLVQRILEAGGDAYGVDPRSHLVDRADLGALDLRGEDLGTHLRAVAPAGLGALVLSGLMEAMDSGARTQLLGLVEDGLAPGGTLVIHSATRESWDAPEAPYEADLSLGRPLRPETWCRLLEQMGYEAGARTGPHGADFLVTATRGGVPPKTHLTR